MFSIKCSLAIRSFIIDELLVDQILKFHVVVPPPILKSFPRIFFCFSITGMWWLATYRTVYLMEVGQWFKDLCSIRV